MPDPSIEAIGIVEAVGPDVRTIKPGDLVVMPFAYSDGTCEFCQKGLHTACVHGGFFGNDGVNGAQAEALRVPFADGTCTRCRSARTTRNVLFGDVWKSPDLAPRDRSLVTVAALVTNGNTGQLTYHLGLAEDNGATEAELIEAITHLAFYTGWPQAMAAMAVAKQVFRGEDA